MSLYSLEKSGKKKKKTLSHITNITTYNQQKKKQNQIYNNLDECDVYFLLITIPYKLQLVRDCTLQQ